MILKDRRRIPDVDGSSPDQMLDDETDFQVEAS